MGSTSRYLIAVWAACIALIAVALAIRIARIVPQALPVKLGNQGTHVRGLTTDPSFYSHPNPDTSTSGKTAPPKKTTGARQTPSGPDVTAKAYLVGDISTGKILFEHDGAVVLPVASMSKLITAIAATDTLAPDKRITITSSEIDVASDTSRIDAGETYTLSEMLYPLLLNSSNVAAEALASTTNRAKFLELMSSYAWEIGMPSTFFADPSGLSPHNQSTAEDFFALARYLYASRPDILAITKTVSVSVSTTTEHGAHVFASIHPFVTNPDFLGGKTGHTPEAGDTMLTILRIGGMPIAIIVLGADSGSRQSDTSILADVVRNTLATTH